LLKGYRILQVFIRPAQNLALILQKYISIRNNIIKGYFGRNFAYISFYEPSGNRTIADIFAGNFPKRGFRTSAKSGPEAAGGDDAKWPPQCR
jgi:hypothetical protein